MNFSFLSLGTYLDKVVNLTLSKNLYSDRFYDAGFDTFSFLLNATDILFMFLVTALIYFVYLFIYKIFCRTEDG